MFRGRDFAWVLVVAAIAVGVLSCGTADPPQVLDLIDLDTAQRNVSDCQEVHPSEEWINEISAIPKRVEVVPESVEDVEILLSGNANLMFVRMTWKAENRYGGTSKREISNGGKLAISDDCSFSLRDGRGWSSS